MSYWNNVFKALRGREDSKELEAATFGTKPEWLQIQALRDRRKLFETYAIGGPVSEALDSYGLFCISPGYKVNTDNERLQKDVSDWLDNISFEENVKSIITDAIICGEGYQEKIKNKGGKVIGLRRREPWTMKTKVDKFGNVVNFELRLDSARNTPDHVFDVKDVVYLKLPSIMERAWDDIVRDTKVADASTEAIVRHGYRKFHVKVGKEGETVPQTTLEKLGRKFEELKAKNEFVTVHDVDIKSLDDGMTGDVTAYSNFTLTRLTAALGVPEELMGLGRGSTEATANVKIRAFYDKIGYYQRIVAKTYNNQLLIDYVGSNKAKITFNDVSPEDNKKKAEYVAAVMGINGADPEMIMSREEARAELGLEAQG